MDKRISTSITDFLNRVPGYTGYRNLEDRRDDDRRVRELTSAHVDAIVQTLSGVSSALAAKRDLTHISVVERLVGSTRLLGDRVRTASYGYGGLFSDRPVDAAALEQLRQFDVAFDATIANLDTLSGKLAAAPEGPLDADISAYQDELNRAGRLFDARSAVVDTARPNRDASVLNLLEPEEKPAPNPFAQLKLKDVFSVVGIDYIADAVLTLRSDQATIQLVRAGKDDAGADVWFAGSSDGQPPAAKLSESKAGSAPDGTGIAGTLKVSTAAGDQAEVPASYGYTGGTDSSVSLWYTVGNETRSFSGSSVDEADIQVYGQA